MLNIASDTTCSRLPRRSYSDLVAETFARGRRRLFASSRAIDSFPGLDDSATEPWTLWQKVAETTAIYGDIFASTFPKISTIVKTIPPPEIPKRYATASEHQSQFHEPPEQSSVT